jgi:hypothetical protein
MTNTIPLSLSISCNLYEKITCFRNQESQGIQKYVRLTLAEVGYGATLVLGLLETAARTVCLFVTGPLYFASTMTCSEKTQLYFERLWIDSVDGALISCLSSARALVAVFQNFSAEKIMNMDSSNRCQFTEEY